MERFVAEYMVCRNQTEAARRAGYSEKRAMTTGSELMARPDVKAEIDRRMYEEQNYVGVTPAQVLAQWKAIGFGDIRDLFEWDNESMSFVPSKDLTEEQAATVKSIKAKTVHIYPQDGGAPRVETTLEIQTHDKLKALDRLADYLELAQRTISVTGQISHHHTAAVQDLSDEEILERMSDLVSRNGDTEVRVLRKPPERP